MQHSAEVRDAALRFYEQFSTGNIEGFKRALTHEEGALVIGTAPDDWEEGRERWISAAETLLREMQGMRVVAGDELRGYEEGSMGWIADRPSIVLPDDTTIPARLTSVVRWEEGEWKLVHNHFSFGVPDEELVSGGEQV